MLGPHRLARCRNVEVPIEECFEEFGWEVTELTDASISDGDPPQDADDDDSDLDWEGSVDAALDRRVRLNRLALRSTVTRVFATVRA